MRFLSLALVGVMFCGCAPTHTAYIPTLGDNHASFVEWSSRSAFNR